MSASRVLVLNAGSSSLKASLVAAPDTTLARAGVSWGSDASRSTDRAAGVAEALTHVGIGQPPEASPEVVAYRVVHGGDRFTSAVVIDEDVTDGIDAVRELAPLHNGVAIETIQAGRMLLPSALHVACFDTAFHASLEPVSYRYPVPQRWYDEWGMRRYGFHGLSVEWSRQRAASLLGRPAESLSLVVAHLGSGCSVTALRDGRSVNTTMGLTPLEGLMMGTRSGSLDPGVLLHLLRNELLDADELADALDHDSGLAGVSGISSDMRALEAAAAAGNPRALLAISMFIDRAATWIGAMATSLTRLDGLVFTGGIGEHAVAVRRGIVERAWRHRHRSPAPSDRERPAGSR